MGGAAVDCLNYKSPVENHADVDRIVVFDIIGAEQLIRVPKNLWDAYIISIIVPLVEIARDDTKIFQSRYNTDSSGNEIMKLMMVKFDIPDDEWPSVLDWSRSNLKRCLTLVIRQERISSGNTRKTWYEWSCFERLRETGPPKTATPAIGGRAMPSASVLRRSGGNLRGGKFSFVARTQRAVNEALIACGREGVGADGVFGRKSEEAVERLAGCPGFGVLGIGSGQPNDGTVTAPLWSRLFPGERLPTVEQRAHVLWLTHEATDYDQVEFNFKPSGEPQPNDLHSFLTWGPYGATVGHGREVQQVLRRPEVDALLNSCFGDEAGAIHTLVAAEDNSEARELVKSAFLDQDRRTAWRSGFQCLGSKAEARDAYDRVAFGRGALGFCQHLGISRPFCRTGTTEIDFAFFIDLAMHMSISDARVAAAAKAIESREAALGRALNPPETRREIGQALVAALSNQVEDRRGRNVVYYVDGLGEDVPSYQELDAWRQRSGIRAGDVGLSDEAFAW